VEQPDFGGLTENDIVLVFLRDARIAGSVSERFKSTKAADNVYYFYDVLEYLAQMLFPKLTRSAVNYRDCEVF
jgi:hypothetical protein